MGISHIKTHLLGRWKTLGLGCLVFNDNFRYQKIVREERYRNGLGMRLGEMSQVLVRTVET